MKYRPIFLTSCIMTLIVCSTMGYSTYSTNDPKEESLSLQIEDIVTGFSKAEQAYWQEILLDSDSEMVKSKCFIPKGQTPEHKEEAIVIYSCSFPTGVQASRTKFAEGISLQWADAQIKHKNTRLIKKNFQDLTYEIPGYHEGEPFLEMVRSIITENGIHNLVYWKKTKYIDNKERQRMINVLDRIRLSDGYDGDFCLTYETLPDDTTKAATHNKDSNEFTLEYYKTIIAMHNPPLGEEFFTIKINRPLINPNHQRVFAEDAFGDAFIINSDGFFPGEKIKVVMESKNGKIQSQPIQIIPRPIELQSSYDNAKITAELLALKLTTYKFYLGGLPLGEKVHFHSISYDEEIENQITNEQKHVFMYYAPAVVDKEGGYSHVTFEREQGEKLKHTFPWGDRLLYQIITELGLDFKDLSLEQANL